MFCFFWGNTTGDENHRWTNGRTLSQWVPYFEDAKDCMVAHIGGVHTKTWYNKGIYPLLPGRPKGHPDESYIVRKEHFLLARKNLLEMGWVGIFEKFGQSVKQLKMLYGESYMSNTNINRKDNANNRKPKQPLTNDEIKIILEYNHWDKWLYDLGNVLYDQQALVLKYLYPDMYAQGD